MLIQICITNISVIDLATIAMYAASSEAVECPSIFVSLHPFSHFNLLDHFELRFAITMLSKTESRLLFSDSHFFFNHNIHNTIQNGIQMQVFHNLFVSNNSMKRAHQLKHTLSTLDCLGHHTPLNPQENYFLW